MNPSGKVVPFETAQEHPAQALLDSAPDAMIVVDGQGTLVLVNQQAEQLFGYQREELIGQKLEMLLPERIGGRHSQFMRQFNAAPSFRPMGAGLELFGRHRDGSEIPVDISLSPLQTKDGLLAIASIRDISERKRADKEREFLIAELKETLTKVKLLSGYLPTCASCKKIRNENGQWETMEAYIHHHSEAQFTHTLCPDCGERLYPGLIRWNKDKDKAV